MIESLSKRATIRLVVGMKIQAERDLAQYGKPWSSGGCYVSSKVRDSAAHFLEEDFPVIKEILSGSLRN